MNAEFRRLQSQHESEAIVSDPTVAPSPPTYSLVIPGNPIPQARPRFFLKGNRPCVFDPQHKEKFAVQLQMRRWIMQQNLKEGLPIAQNQAIEVSFVFGMPAAENRAKKGQKNRFLWELDFHTKVPDVSNMVKFYEDAANGILWHDDSQIIRLEARKQYTEIANTEINFSIIKTVPLQKGVEDTLMIFSPSKMEEFITDAKRLSQNAVPQNIADPHFQLLVNQVAKFAATYADDLKKIAKMGVTNG